MTANWKPFLWVTRLLWTSFLAQTALVVAAIYSGHWGFAACVGITAFATFCVGMFASKELHQARKRYILDKLAEGPCYALTLVRESGGLVNLGTVHVTLSLMEDAGLIESAMSPPCSTLPPRRMYFLKVRP